MRQILFFVFLMLYFTSCDILENDTEPEVQLTELGFLGTMPVDTISFLSNNLKIENGGTVTGISGVGTFVSVALGLRDTISQISISIELPEIKTENDTINLGGEQPAENSPVTAYINQKYPYETVKNMLSLGDKPIRGDQINGFRLGIVFQNFFRGFYSDGNQEDNYLKVVDLDEDTETNANNETVRTLEVTFDVKINMFDPFSNSSDPVGEIKGLLRMKYIETL
ncbi:MAG: hypothetical protein NW226_10325 [Microscillaceae bacterium]|nr:hypothetical protein [Microscillaceae bacterium]